MKWLLTVESGLLAGSGLYLAATGRAWAGIGLLFLSAVLLNAAMRLFEEEEE